MAGDGKEALKRLSGSKCCIKATELDCGGWLPIDLLHFKPPVGCPLYSSLPASANATGRAHF